ncbi:fructose-6-phosphate aldolase [Rhodohalobacter sulfatireducens]|uniref:Probable transaldolase n=1 Tax=Rhodohalobacter sulfatireducens TaxID=2911366 RepID=A0ABS9KEY3_9BACT|nr:fructose-6-phosphate aldolase [Rhodohalobacter sulfatireducens]MCG2589407.1 fructose-6-phosphate aldolase [Rhodohalobacter sulfatireducens]
MKFFIDTADLNEIQEANDLGVLDGVTTNPSLCHKVGVSDFEGHIAKICDIVDGDVSAEVISTEYADIIAEGRNIASIADNVVVKVPLIKDGIKAIKTFTEEGIKTNCTLCFSATQAMIAAKAGATYISPFIGRVDDISNDGMTIIEDIVQIYDNYGFETEILAASIRHPMHVLEAARLGADVATMPLKVIEQLLKHPLTDTGLERFISDWEKLQESLKK